MSTVKKLNKKIFPIIGLLPVIAVTPALYWLISQFAMTFPPLDLKIYKRAANFVFAGNSPYSSEFITPDIYLPWVYTPFGTLLLLPLHFVSDSMLLPVWTVFGILVPLTVLVLLSYQAFFSQSDFSKSEKKLLFILLTLLAASTGPVIDTWAIGQIGLILVALTLYDLAAPDSWFKYRRISLSRGVLAGIAGAIKLVPLIVIPFWLITRQWRAAATATLTLVFAWGLALMLMPADSIKYFSERRFLGTSTLENVATSDNQSLIGTVMRITNTQPLSIYVWVPILISVVFIGLMVARATYRNGHLLNSGIIVGLTSVLASPVSWIHHIVWLVAIPGALLGKELMRTTTGKISKSGWLWFIAILVMAIPPVRYGWSPFRRLGIDEQYSVLCALLIWLLWWISNKNTKQQIEIN
jgi:alpha-1,2-mannosyltransferase